MKLDFTQIEIPRDLKGTHVSIADIKEDFANLIYTQGTGIACHALALKIYNGETEFNEKEVNLIQQLANALCTPAVADGVKKAIEKGSVQTK